MVKFFFFFGNIIMLSILYFTAKWCAPCHYFEKIVEKVLSSTEFSEKFSLTKIDVDKYPDMMNKYEVMAVPTVIVINDKNQILGTVIGAKTSNEFEAFLKSIANKYL